MAKTRRGSTMIAHVDGQPVSPALLTYRDLGFGQPVEFPLHEYRLVYGRGEFVNLLSEAYREFLADQKADDERTGDPYPAYFQELGYPSLEELFEHPVHLDDAVIRFLWDDLLALTFPDAPRTEGNWKWVINSIDKVETTNDTVVVQGKVFERQPVYV
jgi:hypothetical protein